MTKARANENWSREEHIFAFNLHCKIPFGTIDMRNPRIIALASLLDRSVGSVCYKLANFEPLDPALHQWHTCDASCYRNRYKGKITYGRRR